MYFYFGKDELETIIANQPCHPRELLFEEKKKVNKQEKQNERFKALSGHCTDNNSEEDSHCHRILDRTLFSWDLLHLDIFLIHTIELPWETSTS